MSHHSLRLRLAAILVGVIVASCSFGGNGGGNGTQTTQPFLIASYCFDNSVGTGQTSLTVTFNGILQSDPTTTFSKAETRQFQAGTPSECVVTQINNLKSGEWRVTAIPNGIGAPKTCPANVPGRVTLNVQNNTCS